ncbi:hypothetical protein LTR70_003619 [Exophiala xenobiotica]|uniref:Uncharacterized protein n=1 Tax=Lithohypha guttulata TaxID=1690604 RepID=A0ABR0KFQ0_9EURO|nr:hypothetical protein LTR24_003190 [Lithohypha guttulata]KAK5322832.1 hypothetical protein LTR70_003619 [Exophiala xenobiotica]
MFARATNKADNVQNTVRRRWQSASASAVALQQEQAPDNELPVRRVSDNSKDDRPQTTYRHWQPPQTADLGVSVLGKPAEILVLPQGRSKPRNREGSPGLPKANEAGDAAKPAASQEKPQLSVREALAQERRPVSPSEVNDNIEKLRREIAEPTDKPYHDTLREYQHSLASGFSKAQLRAYIAVKGAKAWRKYRQTEVTKKALACFIFERIWGFDTAPLVTESSEPTAACISVSPLIMDLIRISAKYASTVSRLPDTLLRYDSLKAWLWIYGKDKDIEKIKTIFLEHSNPITKTFTVTSSLGTVLKGGTADHTLLREMANKLGVVAKASKEFGKLQCWAFSEVNLQSFERELICWQAEQQVSALYSPPLSLDTPDNLSTVPVYTDTSVQNYRHLSFTSPDRVLFALRREVGEREQEVAHKLWEVLQAEALIRPTDNLLLTDNRAPGRFSPEYSVELGQAIFQRSKKDQASVNPPFSNASTVSGFVSLIPLLPQFLAQRLPSATATSPASDSETSRPNDQPLRITLQPADPNLHPSIEIYATSTGDSSSSLVIQEVSLVSTKNSQILLLPNTPVDLKFCRRDKYILTGDGLPIEQRFTPLLAQIAEQLFRSDNDADGKPRANASLERLFSPIFHLNLSGLEPPSADAETTALRQNGTQGKIRNFDKASTEADAMKKTKPASVETRYALDSIEAIDAAVYSLGATSASTVQNGTEKKGAPRLFLEHLDVTQIGSNPVHSRSELVRIVEQPMLRYATHNAELMSGTPTPQDRGMIGREPKRFQAFVRSAYKTVVELDDFIRKRTKAMAQARQKPE